MKTAPRTPNEALQSCADQSHNGPPFGKDHCQMEAHLRYLVPSDGTPTAARAWSSAQYKFATNDPSTAPRGAFQFWLGGSSGAGHVDLQREQGKTSEWSTDIKRDGYYDVCDHSDINREWGSDLSYVGWSLDNDGVLCVPGAVDYLNSLLHPSAAHKPVKPEPLPLPARVKVLHRAQRRARAAGHHTWAARLGLWAEAIQRRVSKKATSK